ncbi:MAG TPA: hypothetical protein VFQ77_12435 [Pseudonocardiaceae bacterium]|jgi:hypothetical protein|nr:hypothetical protein [Pseudonocardiaceae bacterium]
MGNTTAGQRICVACRGTVLSRYNPDPVCAGCARAAREPAGIVPDWLWDALPLRAALARVDLAAFPVLVRRASRLSLRDLGSRIGPGWSVALLSMIERGQRDTLYDIRKLFAFVDAVGMPRAALAPLILGDPDGTLDGDEFAALWGVDTMGLSRREFAALTGGLGTGLGVAAALPVPPRVDLAQVRSLQAALVRLRDQDDVLGGGGVLAQGLRLFGQARRMLDESDYSEAVGRELLVVTADLGLKSAWSAFDAGNQPLARRLYEQSALLVDSADDDAQRAYLYANMLQQSTRLARYTGRKDFAREALRFGDRAADAARHQPSPALRSLVWMRRSLAHAQLGDAAAFRADITTARRELDRGPHETDTLRTRFVRHSEITAYEAAGQAALGAHPQAVRLLEGVLDDTARSPRDQACFRARLAGNLVAAGDPEQAIHHGLLILPELGAPLISIRPLQELWPVRDAAAVTGIAGAGAEFCEKFDTAARVLRAA